MIAHILRTIQKIDTTSLTHQESLRRFVFHQWCIPYRVWSFTEKRLPIVCYLHRKAANRQINTRNYWNDELTKSWDDAKRQWPIKSKIIEPYIEEGTKILDCGCGTGEILKYLERNGKFKLYGLDFAVDALRKLRNNHGIHLINSSLPSLPVKDSVFDTIILSEVLEHLWRHRTMIKEIWRVLTDNGNIIVTVPDNCLGPLTCMEHIRQYNNETLTKLLSKYFHVQEVKSFRDKGHNSPTLMAVGIKIPKNKRLKNIKLE